MPRSIPTLALVAAILSPGAVIRAEIRGETVRGITISTHTDGRDWATDGMAETIVEAGATGAGWVAIHPYAAISGDGRVRFDRFDPARPPEYLARPIREAHARGLKILIKPHLAYWGSPFRWRGEIEFQVDEHWQRFWRDYEAWIVNLAAATRAADGFVVGTELDRSLRFEREWRRIIRRVREQTRVSLTYAANWTDFEQVPFWDALDVIGIQAYFPLSEQPDPGQEALTLGWRRWMDRLRVVAQRHNRAIVFTELGYNRAWDAPVRPWNDRSDGPEALRVQSDCLRAALDAIEREPSVLGAFLWKWFPAPLTVERSFQLADPAIKRVIREIWSADAIPSRAGTGPAAPAGR